MYVCKYAFMYVSAVSRVSVYLRPPIIQLLMRLSTYINYLLPNHMPTKSHIYQTTCLAHLPTLYLSVYLRVVDKTDVFQKWQVASS
jgi:hypothetical protein